MTNNIGGGSGDNNVWTQIGQTLQGNISQTGGTDQRDVDSFEVYQQAGVAPSQGFLNKLNADTPGIPTLRIHYAAEAIQILRDPNMTPEQKQAALKQLETTTSDQMGVLSDPKVTKMLTSSPWLEPSMMNALLTNLDGMQEVLLLNKFGDDLKTNTKQISEVLQNAVESNELYQKEGVAPSQEFFNRLSSDSPGLLSLSIQYSEKALGILNDPTLTPEQKEAALKQLENTTSQQMAVLEHPAVSSFIKANPFLMPNMMVQLNMNLTEMMQMLKEAREAELGAKITGMNMVWETGLNISALTMAAAKSEAAMKFIEGAVGLAQAGANVGFAAMGVGSLSKSGAGQKLSSFMVGAGGGTALSGISTGLGQAVNGFSSSSLIVEKAHHEALKSISETLKQLESQLLQSAGEAMGDLEGLLTKALEMMQRIWEQNAKSQQTLTGKPM